MCNKSSGYVYLSHLWTKNFHPLSPKLLKLQRPDTHKDYVQTETSPFSFTFSSCDRYILVANDCNIRRNTEWDHISLHLCVSSAHLLENPTAPGYRDKNSPSHIKRQLCSPRFDYWCSKVTYLADLAHISNNFGNFITIKIFFLCFLFDRWFKYLLNSIKNILFKLVAF